MTAYFHRGKWVANVLVSVFFPLGTYLMFVKVFGVMPLTFIFAAFQYPLLMKHDATPKDEAKS